jgi:heme/copper-type cytochrome/quinol oxidase subunit 4
MWKLHNVSAISHIHIVIELSIILKLLPVFTVIYNEIRLRHSAATIITSCVTIVLRQNVNQRLWRIVPKKIDYTF